MVSVATLATILFLCNPANVVHWPVYLAFAIAVVGLTVLFVGYFITLVVLCFSLPAVCDLLVDFMFGFPRLRNRFSRTWRRHGKACVRCYCCATYCCCLLVFHKHGIHAGCAALLCGADPCIRLFLTGGHPRSGCRTYPLFIKCFRAQRVLRRCPLQFLHLTSQCSQQLAIGTAFLCLGRCAPRFKGGIAHGAILLVGQPVATFAATL